MVRFNMLQRALDLHKLRDFSDYRHQSVDLLLAGGMIDDPLVCGKNTVKAA